MHRYGRDGRLEKTFTSHSDVDVKLEDLRPPKWCVFAEQHPLPKVDEFHVPAWVDGAWTVRAKAYYERPDYDHEWDEATESWIPVPVVEPEPSILDSENLVKLVIALVDAVEKQEPIPTETKTLVEAERVKLTPVVEEPVIEEQPSEDLSRTHRQERGSDGIRV